MTRFVIGPDVALCLARDEAVIAEAAARKLSIRPGERWAALRIARAYTVHGWDHTGTAPYRPAVRSSTRPRIRAPSWKAPGFGPA